MIVLFPLGEGNPVAKHTGLDRAFRRQRWTGTLLAVDVVASSAAPWDAVHSGGYGLAAAVGAWMLLDLGSASVKSLWKFARKAKRVVDEYQDQSGSE
ncbi:hypothetical protein [Nocardia sp. alder85J]|uniref:hypothetical protein n=1 Tax=Nocardia sp. alder85J TaxID=2862949 RepID=UPI001CD21731|nr:hypothetical protein [Nocardia sp. alder85J]MCX4099232.1 hypothetical protein [Nocardia sp. alder85J]